MMVFRTRRLLLQVRNRGVAAVELAFVSVLLVLMVLATIDFARAMFVYDQLVKATRDGARYLSFFDPTDAGTYPIDLAKQRMIYGLANPPSEAKPIVPGLKSEMIRVCDRAHTTGCSGSFGDVPTGSGSINLVQVTISGYLFTPIFPGGSQLPAGGIVFEPISTTMRQLF